MKIITKELGNETLYIQYRDLFKILMLENDIPKSVTNMAYDEINELSDKNKNKFVKTYDNEAIEYLKNILYVIEYNGIKPVGSLVEIVKKIYAKYDKEIVAENLANYAFKDFIRIRNLEKNDIPFIHSKENSYSHGQYIINDSINHNGMFITSRNDYPITDNDEFENEVANILEANNYDINKGFILFPSNNNLTYFAQADEKVKKISK